jgi:hypothetical protein
MIGEERSITTPAKTKQTAITWYSYKLSLHSELVQATRSQYVPPPKTDSEEL